jgi:hypothetical protein
MNGLLDILIHVTTIAGDGFAPLHIGLTAATGSAWSPRHTPIIAKSSVPQNCNSFQVYCIRHSNRLTMKMFCERIALAEHRKTKPRQFLRGLRLQMQTNWTRSLYVYAAMSDPCTHYRNDEEER